jgi:hypothetical protein
MFSSARFFSALCTIARSRKFKIGWLSTFRRFENVIISRFLLHLLGTKIGACLFLKHRFKMQIELTQRKPSLRRLSSLSGVTKI